MHYEKFADGSIKCIEDEIPFELPEGWEWSRLTSICSLISDIDHKMPKAVDDGVLFLSAKDLLNDGTINYTNDVKMISEEDFLRLSRKALPQKNDIIYSRIGACLGKARVVTKDIRFIVSYSCCTIRPVIIDSTFLASILDGDFVLNQAKEGTQSVGVPDLGMASIKNFLIPIPPLAQQQKIDVCLQYALNIAQYISTEQDKLIFAITQAKSKILDLAIHGQLMPQNPDDEPASALLERIRAEKEDLIKQGKIKRGKKESFIFKGDDNSYYEKIGKSVSKIDDEIPFTLPEGWEWCKLGSLCMSIQYGLSNSAESCGTHKLLRITDIQNGSVNWDTVPYTTTDDFETYMLKSDDIVFARTGATVGKSFLIEKLPYESVYASFLIRIRLVKYIRPQYIYNFFNSPCYWEQITNKAVGVGQPNCNGTALSNLFIPIPPIEVQDKVVSLLTKLFEYIDRIEKILS